MNTVIAVVGIMLTLWMLYAFRKPLRRSVFPAAGWLLKKLGAVPAKVGRWCWKRRWELAIDLALLALFTVAVGVPAAVLFPNFFGIGKIAGIHLVFRIIFALAWVCPCWGIGEPLQLHGISFLGFLWRSVPSGLHFLFRPLGIRFERIFKSVPVENFEESFDMDIEVQKGNDRDFIPVKVVYNGGTRAKSLPNWLKFPADKRQGAIQNWIRSIMTFVAHDVAKTMDELYNKKPEIERRVTSDFIHESMNGFTLPGYFGVDIHRIGLADVEMPADLKSVTQEKKKQEEIREARKVELKSVRERAKTLITLGVDPNEAVKAIDVRDGKRTATINENKITFGPVIEAAVGEVVATMAAKFLSKKSKNGYNKKI